MDKRFIALIIASLGTILVCTSTHAGGLAFDAAGNLFVADFDRHSVFKYTPDRTKSSFAVGLKGPLGLCFDGKDNLFVSDGAVTDAKSQRSILKFGSDGTKSTFVSGISSVGMAFDRSGNLFVSQGDSIFKFTPERAKSTFVSGLGNPIDLAFDGAGNLFVVDMAVKDARVGRSIFRFSPDGTKSTFATGLLDPGHLAVDAAGNVYVTEEMKAADASSHAILKFSPDGTQSTLLAVGWARPLSIVIDRSGNVFVLNEHSILKFDSSGTKRIFASDWVSPDKQWEYRCDDGLWSSIVRTDTNKLVLNLSTEVEVPYCRDAQVMWAPDSKRFAFNYSPPHKPHTSYETIALYQLRGDKWVALRSPVEETSERSQLVQLAKEHLPKSAYPRHAELLRDILKVREWTDANTAILYAYSAWQGSGPRSSEARFLFTLRCDAEGCWKIVKTHRMSEKEVEEKQRDIPVPSSQSSAARSVAVLPFWLLMKSRKQREKIRQQVCLCSTQKIILSRAARFRRTKSLP